MEIGIVFISVLILLAFIFAFSTVKIVPQQQVYVVERLGKFHGILNAGMHFIIPFVDQVSYHHSLKEFVLDIPEQVCITRDNVQVNVDGILFFRVIDAQKASYGVSNYTVGLVQLAQTTLRSEVGKIELDKTFEEREAINAAVVTAIDKASDPWGVKILRYEIKSITPPREILAAMEKQMKAEREKRALILESEGDRDSKINRAEGSKQEVIKKSEAEQQKQINEAKGQAAAILSIAEATARGLEQVGQSISVGGGIHAAQLKLAEEYIKQFGALAKHGTTMLIPTNANDIAATIATAFSVLNNVKAASVTPQVEPPPPRRG